MTVTRGHARGAAMSARRDSLAAPAGSPLVTGQPELLAAMLDSTSDVVFLEDLDGRLVYANAAMGRFLGRPHESLVGLTERDLFPPSIAEAMIADNAAVMADGGVRTVEEHLIGPDGAEAWSRTTKGPIRDGSGRVTGMFGLVRDITAQKRAEHEAQAVGVRYRAALDGMLEGAVILDRDWNILYANPSALNLAGVGPAESLTGAFDRVWAGVELPTAQAQLERCLRDGVVARFSTWVRIPGGTRRWLNVVAQPVPDGMLLLALDATEARVADEAVRRSEERLRSTLDGMLEGVAILDANLRVIYANEVAARHAGLERGSLAGRRIIDVHPRIAETPLPEALRRAVASRAPQQFETSYRLAGEEAHWFHFSIQPVPEGLVVLSIDVTDRHLAERRLHASQAMLQGVADSTTDAIYAKDLEGRYTFLNAAAARVLGGAPEELLGRDDRELFPGDEAATVMISDQAVLRGGRPIDLEEHVTSADGVERTFRSVKGPIRSATGEIIGLHGISRDTTEREQVLQALRDSEERFRAITERSILGIYVLEGGRVSYANQALADMFGYQADEIVGLNPADLAAERDRPRLMEAMRRRLAGDPSTGPIEIHGRTRDGESRAVLIIGNRAMVSGRPVLMGGMLDITDQVAARRALEASEVRFRSTTEALLDPLVILSPIRADDGTIVDFRYDYANHAADRALAGQAGGVAGHTLLELLPHFDGTGLVEAYARTIETGEPLELDQCLVPDLRDGQLVPCWYDIRAQRLGSEVVSTWRDVSFRVRAQAELRASEQALLEAQRVGRTGSWTWDIASGRQAWSAEMFRLTGVTPEASPPTFATLGRLLAPADVTRLRAAVSQSLDDRQGFDMEADLRRSSGDVARMLLRCSPDLDAEGRVAGLHGTLTDVTDLRRAEREAHDLRAAIQQSGAAFSLSTLDGEIRFANRAARRLFGVDPDEEARGVPADRFYADKAEFDRWGQAILAQGGTAEMEIMARRPDGSTFPVLGSASVVRDADGEPAYVVVTHTDLTELRRAETEAQDLKAAIDQSAASFSLASLDGTTIYANAAARRLFGGEGADLDPVERDGASFYADKEAFDRWRAATQASGSAQAELTAVRPDGTLIDLLCSASIVRDASGRPRFVVASHVDLTEIRRAEAALRASETALIEAQRVGRTGSWTWNRATGQATWSAQVERIAGLAPSPGEAPMGFLGRWLGEAEAARAQALINLTLADGSERDLEVHWRRAPEEMAWALARFVPDRDEDGRITGLHGTLTDVTDLHIAEQVARNLKAAIDGSAVSFAIADIHGHNIYANDAARRLFGFDPTAPTEGRRHLDFIVDQEAFGRYQRDAREHGYAQAELTARRADGTVFQMLGTSSIIRDEDGRPILVASSHLDLTDLRRAEAAEREAEEHARRTVSTINGIIRYKAHAGSPIVVSPQVREILGYEPHEVADGEAWAAIVHPDDLGLHLATRVAHPDRGEHDYRIRRKDGEWLWVRQSTRGMRAPDGAKDGFVAVVTDISAHKEAEEQLQASVTRLRRFIDSNLLGVVVSEVGGRVLEANDYYLAVVGRSREEFERGGLDWKSMTPPEFAETDVAAVQRAIRDGSTPAREKAYRRPDGTLVPVLISHALIGGDPVQVASFVVDLSERQEAERRIRDSEERLHAALDAMLDPFVIASIDPDGQDGAGELRVEFANEAFAEVVGVPSQAVIGGPIPEHAVSVEGRSIQDIGRAVLDSGGHWRRDAAAYSSPRHPEGTGGLVSMQVAAFDTGFFATWRDVTELEHGRTERERLAAAIEQTIDMVLVTDAHGSITFVNAAFAAMCRLSPDTLVGQPARPILVDLVGASTADLLDVAARDGQPVTSEYSVGGHGADRRHFEIALTPIRDAQRQTTSVVMVTRDITDLREAERELLLEADLRRILAFTLQRVPSEAHAQAIADELCEGLASRDGIDFVAVLAATADGLRPIASRGEIDFGRPGVDFGSLAEHLATHGTAGPWATLSDAPDHDHRVCRALTRPGLHAAAFGPIVHGDHADGVLMIGTYDAELAPTFVRRMPDVGDFSNTPSALLAGHLHGLRESTATQAQLTEIMAVNAWEVLFQPIVDMSTGLPVGYEALTRFDSGQRADLAFGSAWEVGLGEDLELATLRAAVAEGRKLPSGRWLDLNVSPRFLDDRDRLAELLAGADRPVVLEITEHEAIRDYGAIRNVVSGLGAEVRLAVDDAGAGVANFSHIVELRADFVKLDIGLVRGINANFARQALVNGMRHFSRTTGCRLIAEGIETPEESATLTTLGIEYGQGYLYGRPAPAATWGPRPARVLGVRGKTAGQPVRRRRAGPLRGG